MKKIGIFIALGVAMILVLSFLKIYSEKGRKEPEYVFTYAENQPEDYPTTMGGYRFAELVDERTNGRIKIIVQADGVLGDEQSVIKQIQFGGIDFTRASISSVSEQIPKLNVLQMPYLYKDSKHMWTVLEGKLGDEFLESFADSDMVALSWYDAGARNFYNAGFPIRKLEDMKGLRIRVQQTNLMVSMVEALGAIAVPTTYADVYSNFEQGIIDGAENNFPSFEASDHYEVAKYFTMDEHTRVPEVQLCARSTWNKLSSQDQQIIQKCAEESAIYERVLWDAQEKRAKEIANKNGVEIINLSEQEKKKFRTAVKGIYQEYCGEYVDLIQEIIEESQ